MGTVVTLKTIDRKLSRVLQLVPKPAANSGLAKPELKKGEVHLGVFPNADGSLYHAIVIPGVWKNISHAYAMQKAKDAGGDLPNRIEQAAMFAHHRALFEHEAYWSNTQHAEYADYAWSQYFGYGCQNNYLKDYKLFACAVRREPLQ